MALAFQKIVRTRPHQQRQRPAKASAGSAARRYSTAPTLRPRPARSNSGPERAAARKAHAATIPPRGSTVISRIRPPALARPVNIFRSQASLPPWPRRRRIFGVAPRLIANIGQPRQRHHRRRPSRPPESARHRTPPQPRSAALRAGRLSHNRSRFGARRLSRRARPHNAATHPRRPFAGIRSVAVAIRFSTRTNSRFRFKPVRSAAPPGCRPPLQTRPSPSACRSSAAERPRPHADGRRAPIPRAASTDPRS
jgi:hypothetical protein